MKSVRKGNDIGIAWTINSGETPFSLEGKDITLYLHNPYGKEKVEGYSVKGNVLSWTFLGKGQKVTGKYSLILVVNEGARGMITTDSCDFVNLVPCSCQIGGQDNDGVQTEVIELTSEVSIGGYDDTEIRQELTNVNATALEAHELATLANERIDAIEIEVPEVDLSEINQSLDKIESELTELSLEVSGLSERVENLEQGGQGGGTPSGDPMHYMFEAVGATYNATGADIPMVGIYGDSYVHKAKHWHLNELGDITSEEMREIYAESFPMRRRIILESAFANTNIRTNIPIWKGCDTTAYGSAASTKVSLFGLGCDCSLEVFAWVVDSGEMMNIVKHLNLSSVSNLFDFRSKTPKIKKVLGEINLSNISSTYSMFSRCTSIEEIRLYKLGADLDIKLAPRLSYASIKFLLANSNATSKKTLTLHATALANAEAAYLADVEQDTTTYPTLSDWALSKNIQIATA